MCLFQATFARRVRFSCNELCAVKVYCCCDPRGKLHARWHVHAHWPLVPSMTSDGMTATNRGRVWNTTLMYKERNLLSEQRHSLMRSSPTTFFNFSLLAHRKTGRRRLRLVCSCNAPSRSCYSASGSVLFHSAPMWRLGNEKARLLVRCSACCTGTRCSCSKSGSGSGFTAAE